MSSEVRHVEFRLFGAFAGVTSFIDDGTKEEKNFLRLDYFGGSQTVEIEPEDVARYRSMELGADARLGGLMTWKIGVPKLMVQDSVFENEKGFKPLTLEERLQGSTWSGLARIRERFVGNLKDGSKRFTITAELMGGLVRLVCPVSVFKVLGPDGSCIMCRGHLQSNLRYDSERRARFVELEAYLDAFSEVDLTKLHK